MTNIMRILSVLSNVYEMEITEFISPRSVYKSRRSHNCKRRAFKVLSYFCYEAWLNGETQLSMTELAKLIHLSEHLIIADHTYISDRMENDARSEIKTIKLILERWKI